MDLINLIFGICLIVLFVLVLFCYYLLLVFYKRIEKQRMKITKLVREIAIIKKK